MKSINDYTSNSVWSSLWARAIESNPFVRQLPRQGNLSARRRQNREGTSTADNIIQREGLGLMVWSTQVNCPLNIVKYNEPKMLTGSNQNGKQSDNPLNFGITRTTHCRWNRQDLTHLFVTYTEHSKPISLLPIVGKRAARQAYMGCGYRISEKANASLQWRRYGLSRSHGLALTTSSDTKVGRLPIGNSLQNRLQNF